VARSKRALEAADLILIVVDLQEGIQKEDRRILATVNGRPVIVAGNKRDLAGAKQDELAGFAGNYPCVAISALTGAGLDELARLVREVIMGGRVSRGESEPLVTRARHRDALEKCREHLQSAVSAWEKGLPEDLLAIDLWAAVNYLGEITGTNVREDLLDRIFSDFCIGK